MKLLSARSAARAAGVANTVILAWVHAGERPAFRVGRVWKIRPADLDAHLSKLARDGVRQ